MSHTPHRLTEDFPDHIAQMRHLRETDGHFSRIAGEYDSLNQTIHRAETDIEPLDDFHMADLRKRRMALKDEIYGMLTQAEPLAENIGD